MVFGHALGRFDETEVLFVVAHDVETVGPFDPEGIAVDVGLSLLEADFLGEVGGEEVG